jgi:uncharacterized protein with von Willebrand factor type A (vWA) domain
LVRRIWQNRLALGLGRLIRLFLRWLLVWLSYFLRRASRHLQVSGRLVRWLFRPRDPNNLFLGTEAGHETAEGAPASAGDLTGERRHTLLWATEARPAVPPERALETSALSFWRGKRRVTAEEALSGSAHANRRFAYVDLLASQIKRLPPEAIEELDALIEKLARKWLDIDEAFEKLPRRNRLDVGRTLRYNIPRYAGFILNFRWAIKERPIPQPVKPTKILVIGDVSHSMVHYVSIILYFFHRLNFRFQVDSYIFSDRATHSTPFLNGPGTFAEKMERLVAGARSWNAGTRFGTALEEIAALAAVDEQTYVIIATDGKVSLQADETVKIERYMQTLRARAKQVIFMTPSAEFSDGASGKMKPERLGSFKYDFFDIPIFAVGPPLWYGQLGAYADRLYLVRTVQDLIDMTEDLILA